MTNEEKNKILTLMQFEIGKITRGDDDLGFAKLFYREAAEKGDADAQNNLGVTYEKAREPIPEAKGPQPIAQPGVNMCE